MALDGLNKFAYAASGSVINRSRIDLSHRHLLTMNSGDLVPICNLEVLPGDTFDISTSIVCRGLTPIVPVMDNSFLDIYYFFVPDRLIADTKAGENRFRKVMGENFNGFWAPTTETELDTCFFFGCQPQSVANYLRLPITTLNGGADKIPPKINYLDFEAYTLIWNEWFRDQATQAPLDIYTYGVVSNFTHTIIPSDGYGKTGSCLKVNKFHDYFTSALPAPQYGGSVSLPLGNSAPLAVGNQLYAFNSGATGIGDFKVLLDKPLSNTKYYNLLIKGIAGNKDGTMYVDSSVEDNTPEDTVVEPKFVGTNLVADLTNATAATVNQLRQAFAIQKLLERSARCGGRYFELLKAHFDTTIRNDVIQRPEYLGGKRIPLNITQVLQTSSSQEANALPLGFTGAFSNTADVSKSVLKSFKEHGIILGLACIRTMQSYSYGIPRHFSRRRMYDFYFPEFANLGEQAILNKELFIDNNTMNKADEVFGYQEAWAEYRFIPSNISGYVAPGANDKTYAAWSYTNRFTTLPVLNSDFMKQDKSNVANTLAYTDSNLQYICDIYFDIKATRPMPVVSIPGLVDHH